jgi:probable rRNA maturation factor
MSDAEIAISQPCGEWALLLPDVEERCRRAALAALDGAAAEVLPPGPSERLEVSLVLADDAMVRDLNRRYRGQDKPTNVLSFAALDDEDDPSPEDGPLLLGDVILAFETTRAEALADDKSVAAHMVHLVVHGVLHLLGYDHIEEDEAQEMETAERAILAGLGISDPYVLPPS